MDPEFGFRIFDLKILVDKSIRKLHFDSKVDHYFDMGLVRMDLQNYFKKQNK